MSSNIFQGEIPSQVWTFAFFVEVSVDSTLPTPEALDAIDVNYLVITG